MEFIKDEKTGATGEAMMRIEPPINHTNLGPRMRKSGVNKHQILGCPSFL